MVLSSKEWNTHENGREWHKQHGLIAISVNSLEWSHMSEGRLLGVNQPPTTLIFYFFLRHIWMENSVKYEFNSFSDTILLKTHWKHFLAFCILDSLWFRFPPNVSYSVVLYSSPLEWIRMTWHVTNRKKKSSLLPIVTITSASSLLNIKIHLFALTTE